ncbi:MAG: hypothetical protein ACIAQZ_07795 [Sedimentisphaeraceae bacterium JB056]
MANNYSKYQKNVIDNYYKNLDTIMLQKLQELVTELYLVESDSKWEKLWQRVEKALYKLKIKEDLVKDIMHERDVRQLAGYITKWLSR